jgi:hypothetical protein
MKKLVAFSVLLFFAALLNHGQELYQEQKGTHLDWLYFELSSGTTSSFQAGGIFRYRVSKHVDIGLISDFLTQHMKEGYTASLGSPQGNSFTLGPVIGYTHNLSQSGWGIRSSLGLRMTLSSLSGATPQSSSMKLAGYGLDGDISLFKRFHLGKSTLIFPSIGVYAHMTHFTGHNQDHYGLSQVFFLEARERFRESTGNSLRSGTFFQLPVSFQFFGNTRLVLTPTYYLDSIITQDSKTKAIGSFGLGFRLSF